MQGRHATHLEMTMTAGRPTRVRFFFAFCLFVLSGVAFLDRTNISIAGLQISQEYGLGNQRLGWIFSAFLIGYAGFQLPAGVSGGAFRSAARVDAGSFLVGHRDCAHRDSSFRPSHTRWPC